MDHDDGRLGACRCLIAVESGQIANRLMPRVAPDPTARDSLAVSASGIVGGRAAANDASRASWLTLDRAEQLGGR